MQFQLVLLFHQFFIITNALFNYNQTNSLLNIELYQCDTNETIVNSTIITLDQIFDSCDLNCCTKNNSNQTSISYSTTCQVTVQSSVDACLGRLCYSGDCDHFLSSTNMKKLNSIDLSFPWSSSVNSTRIEWPLWKNKSHLSIRYSILI